MPIQYFNGNNIYFMLHKDEACIFTGPRHITTGKREAATQTQTTSLQRGQHASGVALATTLCSPL